LTPFFQADPVLSISSRTLPRQPSQTTPVRGSDPVSFPALSPSRQWRTSWRAPAITCCTRARRSIPCAPSADHADGRRPELGFGFEPITLKGRNRRHPCCTQDRTRTEPSRDGPWARDSVPRTTCTWTGAAMTDECLASNKGR